MIDRRLKELIDWIFEQIISLFNNQDIEIKIKILKKRPRNWSSSQVGSLDYNDDYDLYVISILFQRQISLERILWHESLHLLFEALEKDKVIRRLEELTWPLLSEKQKEILRSFLPKKRKKEL